MSKIPVEKERRDLLLEEYKLCHAGYLTRDQMAQDEFTRIIRLFSLLLTMVVALNVLVRISTVLSAVLTLLIGVTGLFAMFAMLVDLQSTSSAKICLRQRSLEIEGEIGDDATFKLWRCVDTRTKFREERMIKGHETEARAADQAANQHARDRREPESDWFINVARAVLVVWLMTFSALALYGDDLQLTKGIPGT
ncbi:MAG: hypothetical protein AMXMBFR59_39930 [Rhodanobacteraceae bacterium]